MFRRNSVVLCSLLLFIYFVVLILEVYFFFRLLEIEKLGLFYYIDIYCRSFCLVNMGFSMGQNYDFRNKEQFFKRRLLIKILIGVRNFLNIVNIDNVKLLNLFNIGNE